MTDKEFIAGLKRKDQFVFKEFYDKFHLMVFRTCIGFVNNQEEAEEIVQDVFVEAYFSIDKFKGKAKLSTWLYRITFNKSLNFLRKKKTQSFIKRIESFWGIDMPDDGNSNELEAEKQAQIEQLQEAIESLPDAQRKVFILHKFNELPYKDISEVEDITVSAVESLMYRAKKNLIKKLNK